MWANGTSRISIVLTADLINTTDYPFLALKNKFNEQ